jgi:hypothetical protein
MRKSHALAIEATGGGLRWDCHPEPCGCRARDLAVANWNNKKCQSVIQRSRHIYRGSVSTDCEVPRPAAAGLGMTCL